MAWSLQILCWVWSIIVVIILVLLGPISLMELKINWPSFMIPGSSCSVAAQQPPHLSKLNEDLGAQKKKKTCMSLNHRLVIITTM